VVVNLVKAIVMKRHGGFKIFIVLGLCFLSQLSCKKTETIPECIEQKIEASKNHTMQFPLEQVDEYEYNGNRVYFCISGCCDIPNPLFDANCNVICYPSGGISGGGDGRCTDFFENARHIRLIWKAHP